MRSRFPWCAQGERTLSLDTLDPANSREAHVFDTRGRVASSCLTRATASNRTPQPNIGYVPEKSPAPMRCIPSVSSMGETASALTRENFG